MAINPALVFEVGRKTAAGVVQAGKMGLAAGGVVHHWLQEKMPLEDPSTQIIGKEYFPPLRVPVSEHLDYKIKLLENTAQALGTPESFSLVKGIIDHINDDSFKVLFTGRFNTGKSTLLNKLLERDILKTSNGETTKTLAWLMYGEEAAWYHDFGDDLHRITLETIAEIPDEPPVFNVFAQVPAEILKHGAVLIDTPGLEASGEAAALTMEALEGADAVILVVDHYPAADHDKRLIEKLQKEGKGDKLFVVINKMDCVPDPADQESLLENRRALLSEMGVRSHIFPMSCKKLDAAHQGFAAFRTALTAYIDTGLQTARDAGVAQRIKNTAAHLDTLCKETVDFSRVQNAQERTARRDRALARTHEIEREVKNALIHNQRELLKLRESVLNKWINLWGSLQDEVNHTIQNATSAQLNQPNQLLGDLQIQINRFLLTEFQAAEEQIHQGIASALQGAQLPVPQQEGHIPVTGLTRWDKNFKVPSEFGSLGLIAYTFLTNAHGFFSTIACLPQLYLLFVLSPLINKIFEQILKAGHTLGDSVFKIQLQKKINQQYPVVDEQVRTKIHAYFTALSEEMNRVGSKTIHDVTGAERNKIALADTLVSAEKTAELETCQRQLQAIAH